MRFSALRVLSVLLAVLALPVSGAAAQGFSSPQNEMFLNAFANLKAAEAFDQVCDRGKITGVVKERGHSANFDQNRQQLADKVNEAFRAETKGSDADIAALVQSIADDVSTKATADFKRNGCSSDNARQSKAILHVFTRVEPRYLFSELQKHISREAMKR